MVIVGTTIFPVLIQRANASLGQFRSMHSNQENVCFRSNTCRQSEVEQNTLGNDNQVTGFADQSKNTPTPTPIASLIVIKHVRCNFTSGCPAAGQFSITAFTNNGSSFSFRGSESGTSLSINSTVPYYIQSNRE
jgi:hypothetical protein